MPEFFTVRIAIKRFKSETKSQTKSTRIGKFQRLNQYYISFNLIHLLCNNNNRNNYNSGRDEVDGGDLGNGHEMEGMFHLE